MPQLFGSEVSDHTYELNKHMVAQPKAPKTKARQEIDAELRQQFARQFEATWKLLGGPELEREYQFCPTRQWRADYRTDNILIELEGGAFSGGRHVRGKGFVEDAIKYNTATLLGYRVIRIATGMATPSYIETIIASLQQK
jgi:hypothetical protein